MVGDGSYLMLPGELVDRGRGGIKLVIVLVQNHGYASIGALSRSVGRRGFGTHYRAGRTARRPSTTLPATPRPAEFRRRSRGERGEPGRARYPRAHVEDLGTALANARAHTAPVVVHVEADRYAGVPTTSRGGMCRSPRSSGDEAVRAARRHTRRTQAQRAYTRGPVPLTPIKMPASLLTRMDAAMTAPTATRLLDNYVGGAWTPAPATPRRST